LLGLIVKTLIKKKLEVVMKTKAITLIIILMSFVIMGLYADYPVTEDGKSPFVQVVESIRESVVNIQVEAEVSYSQGSGQLPFDDDFFKFFFPNPQLRQPRRSMSMGSGFIFKQDGMDVYIITNNHVVEHGENGTITVTLADKAKYEAEIVGLDAETDLAVIKITIDFGEEITIVQLGDSDNLDIGDWAIAIGNPFGKLGLERTVTVGVISATGRANLNFGSDSPIYQDYIQTDAAINPGNSGGPLLNLKGQVIGVNAAITSTSGGNVGIGFAIPVNLAKKVSNDLLNSGKVVRAYIGILPQEIDSELRESLKLDKVKGVLVAKVETDTPAEDAGMKRGDVILKFDGKDIENVAKFRILIANADIGRSYPVEVMRNNKLKKLNVTLIPRPGSEIQEEKEDKSKSNNDLGIKVESLSSEFAQRYNIDADEGVVISRIMPDSPAASSNLRVGTVILEINQQKITSVKDFKKATKNIKEDVVLLYVETTAGTYQYVTVKMD